MGNPETKPRLYLRPLFCSLVMVSLIYILYVGFMTFKENVFPFITERKAMSSHGYGSKHVLTHEESSNLVKKIYLETNGITLKNNSSNKIHSELLLAKQRNGKAKNYSVISVSTPFDDNYNYVFYVPLTILAWRRIEFDVIVLISGRESDWLSHPVLKVAYRYILEMNVLHKFIDSPDPNRIMISQSSRIFAACFFKKELSARDFVLISDADLWPIRKDVYNMSSEHKILSMNSDCCSPFEHLGRKYKMLPMCNVGTQVSTWLDLIGTNRFLPQSASDIVKYFETEFGPESRLPVSKGENFGWFQDQWMLTILIQEWIDRNNASLVDFRPRDPGQDRIDVWNWVTDDTALSKTDAHLLEYPYKYGTWFKLTPLLRRLYGEYSKEFELSMQYYEEFTKALDILAKIPR